MAGKFILIVVAAAILLVSCTTTPTSPTTWSLERLREQLMLSNLNSSVFGSPGRITRWHTPIPVHTGGLARTETALDQFEQSPEESRGSRV